MKSFKKTMLAACLTAASGAAFAAGETVVDATPGAANACFDDGTAFCSRVSSEAVDLGNVIISHTGVDFNIDNDLIGTTIIKRVVVTVIGASFTLDADNVFGGDGIGVDGGPLGTVPGNTNALSQITPALADLDRMEITFTNTADFSAVNTINLRDLRLNLDGATSGDTVLIRVEAQRQLGENFVTVTSATGQAAQLLPQLSLSTNPATSDYDPADAKVDPTARLAFSGNVLEDGFTFEINDAAVAYNPVTAVSGGQYTLTVEGDFSFLDVDGDEAIDNDFDVTPDTGVTLAFADDFQSLTLRGDVTSVDGAANSIETGLDIEFDGNTEIPLLTATGTMTFGYGSGSLGGGAFEASATAVNWTLDGSTGTIGYMPYGSGITQIIYVTNNRPNDAAVTVYADDQNGDRFGPVTLDVVAVGNGVTKLQDAIRTALIAEGFSGSGPVELTITTDSTNVTYFGSYNVRGDRNFTPVN